MRRYRSPRTGGAIGGHPALPPARRFRVWREGPERGAAKPRSDIAPNIAGSRHAARNSPPGTGRPPGGLTPFRKPISFAARRRNPPRPPWKGIRLIGLLGKFGFGRRKQTRRRALEAVYPEALERLLAKKGRLSFVIVGANDGRINDPSFGFIRDHADRARVLAIEPQADLHPLLRENYGFLPDFTAVQAAVGEGDGLRLYKVRKEFWGAFAPSYATGWPAYRAPTGITSSDRRHVEEWVRKWSTLDPDDVIEPFTVDCAPLAAILERSAFGTTVDVLQIDAEGLDDAVAYACGIPDLRPAIVLFEIRSLPEARAAALTSFLSSHGYRLRRLGGNMLAERE